MAAATPPRSQLDSTRAFAGSTYSTNGSHQTCSVASSPTNRDGMQYFDFEAFGQDARSQLLQEAHGTGIDDPDIAMPTNYDAVDCSAYHPDPQMCEKGYNDGMADGQRNMSDDGENSEPDASDDEDADLLHDALDSYYSDNPLHSRLVPSPPRDFEQQLSHPEELARPGYSASLAAASRNEKWHVDKESAEFLASVMKLISGDDLGETLERSTRNPLRKPKLDEPLLETDPQIEIVKLFERNEVHLSSEGIAECALDDEKDESLRWPKQTVQLPKTIHHDIMCARLEIDAETLKFLHGVEREQRIDLDDWLKQDREKRLPPRPASPPILPLSPPYSPEGIDPVAAEIALTSSAEDPSRGEANAILACLLERDDLAMQKGAEEAAQLVDEFTTSSSSPCRRRVKRMLSLKVSSPLLPREEDEDEEPPAKKARVVCFSDELETVIPQLSDDDLMDQDVVFEEIFDAIVPGSESARNAMQQPASDKELLDIDTTLRIPVLAIEAISATPPWSIYGASEGGTHIQESQHRLIQDTCDSLSRLEVKWSMSSKAEQALQWLPFPHHLGKPMLEGDFDDGSLARFLTELNLDGEVDLERLTWKPDGLRLLDVDEIEYDELDVAEFESEVDSADTEAPMLPGASGDKVTTLPPVIPHGLNAPLAPKDNRIDTHEWSSMDSLLQSRKMQLREGAKSARSDTGLDMFAKVHGLKYANVPAKVYANPSNAQKTEPSNRDTNVASVNLDQPQDAICEAQIPLPEIQTSAGPLQVIMSHIWMQNHQFVRRLQKLLPNIDMIERDFTFQSSGADPRKPIHASADLEADITISPGTGVMFTNLQKLKQKPLPGQNGSFGMREKVAVVATRYERLIVLVGDRPTMDDNEAPLHIMDVNDSAALADLINQTAVLETDVEVTYVAGGIDKLVKWTAAAISRNASDEHRLLREETLWERFLRKAGMNAYAAQALLVSIQSTLTASGLVSDGSQAASPSSPIQSGLAAFVRMGSEQRIQCFGPVVGGDRLLRRVNRVLDAGWMSSS